jgi:methionyl-tRNA formyltransferase
MKHKIVFFGSGPVAASSLDFLRGVFDIEHVYTKPRPDHHKGPVPVLDLCLKHSIPFSTVTNKKTLCNEIFAGVLSEGSPRFFSNDRKKAGDAPTSATPFNNGNASVANQKSTGPRPMFASRLGVVVDFGIIIPQAIIDVFPLGIINSHFSLLPQWRGADPITFSLLSGQPTTGVAVMRIVEGLDEGPLLGMEQLAITPEHNNSSLTKDLIDLSNKMLQDLLPRYILGLIAPYDQDTTIASSYSRKLNISDAALDFSKPADVLEREVRAFSSWPKSKTILAGLDCIITKSHAETLPSPSPTQLIIEKNRLGIACSNNSALWIDELKPAGKPAMPIAAFINGYRSKL